MNDYERQGKLDIIMGPMFSGKSSELLRKLSIYANLKLRCIYINYTGDTRSGKKGGFSSHYEFLNKNITGVDNIDTRDCSTLTGLILEEYDVIGIDEAQFFGDTLSAFCDRHVDGYKKHVIVCGLDGDSNRNKFGYILDLIPKCDTVKKYRSSCADCAPREVDAPFTHKYITVSSSSSSSSQIDIGGKEKYKPLCRSCYLKHC